MTLQRVFRTRLLCGIALSLFALPQVPLAADLKMPADTAEWLNPPPPKDGKPPYPISDGVRIGSLIYLSGKLGTLPGTGTLAPGGVQAEARQALENIRSTLATHNLASAKLIKCTIFLADIKQLPAFNEVYRTFFPENEFPGRSAVGVSGLALNAQVEVECIATISPGK